MTPAGLEPAIPGSVGRCLIHWATGPLAQKTLQRLCQHTNNQRNMKNTAPTCTETFTKHADMHRNAPSTHTTTQRSTAKHRNAFGRTEHTLNLKQNAGIRAASVWEHSSTRLGT